MQKLVRPFRKVDSLEGCVRTEYRNKFCFIIQRGNRISVDNGKHDRTEECATDGKIQTTKKKILLKMVGAKAVYNVYGYGDPNVHLAPRRFTARNFFGKKIRHRCIKRAIFL